MGNIIRVRVYGEKHGDIWALISLDLNLAAQDRDLNIAISKLDAQIKDFIYDCTVGEDKQWGKQLLARKAPWMFFYKYYKAVFLHTVSKIGEKTQVAFLQSFPAVA